MYNKKPVTGAEVQSDYIIVFHYLFARHCQICGVLILMSVMSVVLGIFLGFHIYITAFNMTTNEFFKWRSVKRWHKREKAKYDQAIKDGKIAKKSGNGVGSGVVSAQVPDGDVGCVGPVATGESASRNEYTDIIPDDEVLDPGKFSQAIEYVIALL